MGENLLKQLLLPHLLFLPSSFSLLQFKQIWLSTRRCCKLCASDWKLIRQFLELNSFNSQTDLENRLRQMPKKGETKKERERHIDRDIKVHFIRQTANELTLKLPASDIFATLWATGQEIYQLEQFRNLVAKLLCTGRIQSNRNGKRKIALLKLNSTQLSSKWTVSFLLWLSW